MFSKRETLRAVVAGLIFFLAATAAVLQTRYDGGFAVIWPASPVLLAWAATTAPRHWPAGIIACGIASVLATGFFGLGWQAAPGLLVANLSEAIIAAMLFRHQGLHGRPVDSLRQLFGFLVATVTIGMVASSLTAAATLTMISGSDFVGNVFSWYIAHALGMICFAPIFIFMARGEFFRRLARSSARQLCELALLTALVVVVAMLVFARAERPMLFLPLLPIMLATFRLGRLSAMISIVALTVVAAGFTLRGSGPIGAMDGGTADHVRFLQFYLAATILTVLPVAAELARRGQLMRDLRHSEARYRILAEHSTDIILNADTDGNIRFVSPAVRGLTGFDTAELLGTPAQRLVADAHVDALADAHRRALQASGGSVRLEYLGRLAGGGSRWFETHMQAVLGEDGQVDGTVAVIRDIGDHKARETSLSDEARRDSLTGLLNRRGFMTALDAMLADPSAAAPIGCLTLFDLDHFKRVNDTHGHQVGDEVLRHFGAVVSTMLRDSDCLARIGGEEFAVLLRATTLEDAAAICDRIREAVAASPYRHRGRPVFMTVSGGVAPLRPAPAAELLALADAALYRAKASGRDRLRLAA